MLFVRVALSTARSTPGDRLVEVDAADVAAHAAHSVDMAYHEAFWLAVAAAGPVIAVGDIVLVGQSLELFANLAKNPRAREVVSSNRLPMRIVRLMRFPEPRVYAVTGLVLVVSTFMFATSLGSLSDGHDSMPTWLAELLQTAPMLALLWLAIQVVVLKGPAPSTIADPDPGAASETVPPPDRGGETISLSARYSRPSAQRSHRGRVAGWRRRP